MSKNSKINEISENLFSTSSQFLRNKSHKEIQDEKLNFEEQLEIEISSLDNYEQQQLLAILSKESKENKLSVFDINGNISVTKIKGYVKSKVDEIKEQKLKDAFYKNNKENGAVKTTKNSVVEYNFKISEKTRQKVKETFEKYKTLTTDEEKKKYFKDEFGIDVEENPELTEKLDAQINYNLFVKNQLENGVTPEQIKKNAKNEEFSKKLTEDQMKLVDGKTILEIQMEIYYEITKISRQESINAKNSENHFSDESKPKLESLKNEKNNLIEQFNKYFDITGLSFESLSKAQTTGFTQEKQNAIVEDEKIMSTLENKQNENQGQIFDLRGMKILESLEKTLEIGISKESIEEAISIFSSALTSLEIGSSKDDLKEMITELQEGASPEIIAILDSLQDMEFERPLDEILGSEEYMLELTDKLSDYSERLGEIQFKEQDNSELIINEFALKPFTDIEFEEAVVANKIGIEEMSTDELDNSNVVEDVENDANEKEAFFIQIGEIRGKVATMEMSKIKEVAGHITSLNIQKNKNLENGSKVV